MFKYEPYLTDWNSSRSNKCYCIWWYIDSSFLCYWMMLCKKYKDLFILYFIFYVSKIIYELLFCLIWNAFCKFLIFLSSFQYLSFCNISLKMLLFDTQVFIVMMLDLVKQLFYMHYNLKLQTLISVIYWEESSDLVKF